MPWLIFFGGLTVIQARKHPIFWGLAHQSLKTATVLKIEGQHQVKAIGNISQKTRDLELFHPEKLKEQKKTHNL